MNKPPKLPSVKSDKDALLSNIALLYYGEGLTQNEIAKRYKLSRVTIVNMLRDCRERGIVEIRVDGQHLAASGLARDLREKYGLQDVYVAIDSMGEGSTQRSDNLAQLARVASMAILDIVEPGDRIGVAWGETIAAVANAMPRHSVAGTQVCQLIGSQESTRVPASEICAIEVANKLGAQCHTLHAPGIVSSAELASALKSEVTIRNQLARLSSLDMTIFAVGHVGSDTHMAAAGIASTAELEAARRQGAAGIICCRYIDKNGQEIRTAPYDRIIAASIDDIKAAPKKLLVVCGSDRLDATRAAIHGGLVTHLVVDRKLAKILINS
ncbi:sugar-binding transcriptional regulator [Roseicitreum antarcticum]|uniref:Dihydroxyacetone kinase n=1 Tax=Roseicitreum antarcticum TaxID=564137 RepID=A0A1H2VBW6_9RHOB|nr:sugar-binding domain-containing protein [Roseicitreum antarcticum]SDW65414.1 dihydroxyacetone kinase [Roseicitreum antarcticum]